MVPKIKLPIVSQNGKKSFLLSLSLFLSVQGDDKTTEINSIYKKCTYSNRGTKHNNETTVYQHHFCFKLWIFAETHSLFLSLISGPLNYTPFLRKIFLWKFSLNRISGANVQHNLYSVRFVDIVLGTNVVAVRTIWIKIKFQSTETSQMERK